MGRHTRSLGILGLAAWAIALTDQGWRIQSRWHVWIDVDDSIQYKSMIAAGIKFPTLTPPASGTELNTP